MMSDAHGGIKAARKAVMLGVPWQRCQCHLQQNAQAYVTKQSKKQTVAADIRALFNAPNIDEAKRQLDLLIEKYQSTQPRLTEWAEDNTPEGLTMFALGTCVNLTEKG